MKKWNMPRRNDTLRMTPMELAIRKAMLAVESLPADERLTEAGTLLARARDLIAEVLEEDCPDCGGTGRDGGSSAPCPTCLAGRARAKG